MKKLKYFFALALFSVFGANADDVTIQGVPVNGELAESARSLMQANVVSNDAQSFSFSDVKFWVGEGENEAALVLQWNVDGEETALVWGYRFDDSATTGYTMLEDIVKADDRLYMVVQNSAFGMTVQGIGYDADGDGEIALLNESGKEQQLGETRIGSIEESRRRYMGMLQASHPEDCRRLDRCRSQRLFRDTNVLRFGRT